MQIFPNYFKTGVNTGIDKLRTYQNTISICGSGGEFNWALISEKTSVPLEPIKVSLLVKTSLKGIKQPTDFW